MPLLLALACTPPPEGSTPATKPAAASHELIPDTGESWTWCTDAPDVRINELVAANHHGALDADGDPSDWIELGLVDGAAATDLSGWAVSDTADSSWPLPEQTLGAAPLLVWASGKDRVDGELHADFGLDAFGDEVFLIEPSGCVADHVDTGRLYADVSLGRAVDGSWAYFVEPTPGESNTTESRPGFADPPTLTAGGFVPAGTETAISGAGTLRYTTDGRVPTEDDPEFVSEIPITGDQPTVVRARAWVDGLWPSRVTSVTYSTDASLPASGVTIISLTTEPDNLFDSETGIYEYGPPDYETWYPYFGANFWESWERDVHVEIFAPGGTSIVDQDAGIQIAGGWSRAFAQRNFEIIARSGYGPDRFDAPVFISDDADSYDKLYLRNGGDWCSTQIVDSSVDSLLWDLDGNRNDAIDAQADVPALVYINGEFWGLYQLKERLDPDWPANHRGADPEDEDFVKVGWTHQANWELEAGDWEAFDQLADVVASEDLSSEAGWAKFAALVDTDNLAASTVPESWISNTDYGTNNLRMWRTHSGGGFRWMVYDFGHGWTDPTYDALGWISTTYWDGLPFAPALRNTAFRERTANIYADFLNSTLAPENAAAMVTARADAVRGVMGMQRDRWCGGAAMTEWEASVAYAESFAQRRAAQLSAQVQAHLYVGAPTPLQLTAIPEAGGRFKLAVVMVDSGFSGNYWANNPVSVTAVPAEGWHFVGWSDAQLGTAETVTVPMDSATSLTAEFAAD